MELFDAPTGHSIVCATKAMVKELLRDKTLAYLHSSPCMEDGCCAEYGTGCCAECDCPCHDSVIYVAKRPLLFM